MFRLLADEGIASAFAVVHDTEWTLIEDTRTQGWALPQRFVYAPPELDKPAVPHVYDFEPHSGLGTVRTTTRHFDYERPSFVIEGSTKLRGGGEAEADLEFCDYEEQPEILRHRPRRDLHRTGLRCAWPMHWREHRRHG